MASFSTKKFKVGVIGATGAVGIEVVTCLFKRNFPLSELHLYASARSAGKIITTEYGEVTVEEYKLETARQCDFIFLAVSGDFALENAPKLIEGDGPIVIDNSSAFRYKAAIPLVVPEINPDQLLGKKLIANPNCTTAIAAVVLWPLHLKYTIKRLIGSLYRSLSIQHFPYTYIICLTSHASFLYHFHMPHSNSTYQYQPTLTSNNLFYLPVSTYQASSGAGQEGMEELLAGSAAKLKVLLVTVYTSIYNSI